MPSFRSILIIALIYHTIIATRTEGKLYSKEKQDKESARAESAPFRGGKETGRNPPSPSFGEAKPESGKRMEGERIAAAKKAGRSVPRDRSGGPAESPEFDLRPASEDQSPRPSGVLAPSAVQARGGGKTRARPRPTRQRRAVAGAGAFRGGAQVARSFAGWQNDAPACDGGGRAAGGGGSKRHDTELVEVAGRLRRCVPSGASAPRGYIVTSICRSLRQGIYSMSK